jgi:hypothetical protein
MHCARVITLDPDSNISHNYKQFVVNCKIAFFAKINYQILI